MYTKQEIMKMSKTQLKKLSNRLLVSICRSIGFSNEIKCKAKSILTDRKVRVY